MSNRIHRRIFPHLQSYLVHKDPSPITLSNIDTTTDWFNAHVIASSLSDTINDQLYQPSFGCEENDEVFVFKSYLEECIIVLVFSMFLCKKKDYSEKKISHLHSSNIPPKVLCHIPRGDVANVLPISLVSINTHEENNSMLSIDSHEENACAFSENCNNLVLS